MTTFDLDGITFVPHINDPRQWVSPGYGLTHMDSWSEIELVAAGAQPLYRTYTYRADE